MSAATKILRQEIQRIKAKRDLVNQSLQAAKAQVLALQNEQDGYDADIAENQAAIATLGG